MSKSSLKIMIESRDYSSWYFANPDTYERVGSLNPTWTPTEKKLFSRDTIHLDGTIVHSPTRQILIPGVLLLEENKSFGRNSKNRLLFQCIPNDRFLPIFLVPFDLKPGFSKHQRNRYVVFKFDNWTAKHPHGILAENLGPVDRLDAFYEYQIYCRSLHESITDFNKTTKTVLSTKSVLDYMDQIRNTASYQISVDPCPHIFTIDPKGSSDFDDAFSIIQLTDDTIQLNIYIANVYVWLDTMGLWRSFTKRVSTIYLPDFRRPMLPTILSDSLCSLEQGQPRFGFRLSLEIKDNQILENTIQFKNVEIRVQHNYVYESMDLLRNPFYQTFLNATQQLDSKIQDSHDVVAFWMIYMNQTVGTKLATKAMGIFRQAALTNPDAYEKTLREMPEELGQDTKRTISNWNHTTGNYVTISKSTSNQPTLLPRHEIMQTHSYIHITSPIRRLVDLLNQMIFSAEYSVVQCLSRDAQDFVQQWITDLDYINTTMRSIRKVQIDCDVLKECYAHPEWMQQRHPGIAFDQVQKTDGTFSCMVYLEHLKILSRINTSFVVENYSRHYFRLFVFEDEHKIKNKIRLELCVG